MKSIDEVLLSPEYIEKLKQTDERVRDLDTRISIEQELRDSVALKIVLEQIADEAAAALEELAFADPSDPKAIIKLQAKVYRARFIARTINSALHRGELAEKSLNEEQTFELKEMKDDYGAE